MVFVYWLFLPDRFLAFIAPVIVVFLYELPTATSFQERDCILLFVFTAIIIGSISFYLIFPFRFFFFFYAILFLAVVYFIIADHFPKFKNASMLIIAVSTINLSLQPAANLGGAYEILMASLLSMGTLFVCLIVFPNRYLIIWVHAVRQFIVCLEKRIEASVHQKMSPEYMIEIPHLGMMRTYRRLVPKSCFRDVCQLSANLRNIEFALFNRFEADNNMRFWWTVRRYLQLLKLHMKHQKQQRLPCLLRLRPETPLQNLVSEYLIKIIMCWNRLCNNYPS